MKENKSMQLKRSIQKKLMAATSMLMVAVIMMVSSTYAWFTLSTAPEVTGITTAVGANGNLEIALANAETWAEPELVSSAVGTSGDNTAWGNLVDVSDINKYGLNRISLMPAELNISEGNQVVGSYLRTPVYGSDGRISALTANTNTGTLDAEGSNKFTINENYGVRAIGTSTQMTPRQSDYRNAKASLASAGALTKTYASRSLYSNGSELANIIVKHALADKDNPDTYTQQDLAIVDRVIVGLEDSLAQAETALNNALKGLIGSQTAVDKGITDTIYEAVKEDIDVTDVANGAINIQGVEIPLTPNLAKAVEVYDRANTSLTSAKEASAELKDDGDNISWTDISGVLTSLVDPNTVTINNLASGEIRDNISNLVNSVLQGGIKVQLPSNSGVYSDVAELAGNYSTSITIASLTYGSIEASNVPATMITTVAVGPYFDLSATEITGLGAPAGDASAADTEITDFYGYAIDMLFRTNAAESNLLLRTTPIDRVYGDDGENIETMGGGATMAFQSEDANFSVNKVAELMKALRVVFLDVDGNILAHARLDMGTTTTGEGAAAATTTNYTINGNEVVADLLIWNEEVSTVKTTTEANSENVAAGSNISTSTSEDGIITKVETVVTAETITTTTTVTVPGSFAEKDAGVITPLTQNVPMQVTAIVYLDGNAVDNSMVATAGRSMKGSMNLQFASDAQLVPMENTALREGSGNTPASSEETQESSEANQGE